MKRPVVLEGIPADPLPGQTRFAINLLADMLVRQPKSFVISTDSGAQ